ncbi:MAG TPA: hypothetical protein VGP31_18695 [Planosporangium sp.]|jgi:hypothetical protein|nr:hypothetical protein [Planosporangium sp.]
MGIVNLDIEICDASTSERFLGRLDEAVSRLGLPPGAYWKWEYSNKSIPVRCGTPDQPHDH